MPTTKHTYTDKELRYLVDFEVVSSQSFDETEPYRPGVLPVEDNTFIMVFSRRDIESAVEGYTKVKEFTDVMFHDLSIHEEMDYYSGMRIPLLVSRQSDEPFYFSHSKYGMCVIPEVKAHIEYDMINNRVGTVDYGWL